MIDGPILEALTFDDVLLLPGKSSVLPAQADTRTFLSRKIALNIPIVAAAMDTVTDSRLAIAISRQGGIGFIHRNMTIARQAEEVDKVKRSESGMIVDPVTIAPELSVRQALDIMNKYRVSGVPVTRGPRLVGILTNRDLRFERNLDQPVSDVMTKDNLITVPVGTTLEEAERILQRHRIEKLLVVDADFNLKGLITVKDIQKKIEFPNATKDDHGRLRVGAAIGATGDFLERAQELAREKVDVLAIDTAHGHTTRVMEAIKEVKRRCRRFNWLPGNVATAEGARDLIALGVDGLKVGIGPGSICTTRMVTGAGVPQITAILEAARAAKGTGVPIIADGGIKFSGDITKAIAAGAQAVMIGGLFAGRRNRPAKRFCIRAERSNRTAGWVRWARWKRARRTATRRRAPRAAKRCRKESKGRCLTRGRLSGLVEQLVGGLRAAWATCGAANLKELQESGSSSASRRRGCARATSTT